MQMKSNRTGNKSSSLILIKYVIPKSVKVSHWLRKTQLRPVTYCEPCPGNSSATGSLPAVAGVVAEGCPLSVAAILVLIRKVQAGEVGQQLEETPPADSKKCVRSYPPKPGFKWKV